MPGDPEAAVARYLDAGIAFGGMIRELSFLGGPRVRESAMRASEAMIDLTSERVGYATTPETAKDVLAQPSPALAEFNSAIEAFESEARRELGLADGDGS